MFGVGGWLFCVCECVKMHVLYCILYIVYIYLNCIYVYIYGRLIWNDYNGATRVPSSARAIFAYLLLSVMSMPALRVCVCVFLPPRLLNVCTLADYVWVCLCEAGLVGFAFSLCMLVR